MSGIVIARRSWEEGPPSLTGGLDREVARVAGRVRAAVCAAAGPRDRARAGIEALLGALGENPDCTWWWVAVWPASPGEVAAEIRARVEDELLDAFAATQVPREIGVAILRDGWALVHEHLWREAEPDLAGLVDPLMALLALRVGGLRAVRAELDAA